MPEQETLERARRDKRQGKAPSTQAGEFVREEMHHIREGKHGARSTKQAIAIGFSKARRAAVNLKPPKKGTTSAKTRQSAEQAYERGQSGSKERLSPKRSRATRRALQRESRSAASSRALSRQARSSARRRIPPVVQRLLAKLRARERRANREPSGWIIQREGRKAEGEGNE